MNTQKTLGQQWVDEWHKKWLESEPLTESLADFLDKKIEAFGNDLNNKAQIKIMKEELSGNIILSDYID